MPEYWINIYPIRPVFMAERSKIGLIVGPNFNSDTQSSWGLEIGGSYRHFLTDQLTFQADLTANPNGFFSEPGFNSTAESEVRSVAGSNLDQDAARDGNPSFIFDFSKRSAVQKSFNLPLSLNLLWKPVPFLELGPSLSAGPSWQQVKTTVAARATEKRCAPEDIFCGDGSYGNPEASFPLGPYQQESSSWGVLFRVGGRAQINWGDHLLSLGAFHQNSQGRSGFAAAIQYAMYWDFPSLSKDKDSALIPSSSDDKSRTLIPHVAPKPVIVPISPAPVPPSETVPELALAVPVSDEERRQITQIQSPLERRIVVLLFNGYGQLGALDYLDRFVEDEYVLKAAKSDLSLLVRSLDSFIRIAGLQVTDFYPRKQHNTIIALHDLLKITTEGSSSGLPDSRLQEFQAKFHPTERRFYLPGTDMGGNLYLRLLYEAKLSVLPAKKQLDFFKSMGCMNSFMDQVKAMQPHP